MPSRYSAKLQLFVRIILLVLWFFCLWFVNAYFVEEEQIQMRAVWQPPQQMLAHFWMSQLAHICWDELFPQSYSVDYANRLCGCWFRIGRCRTRSTGEYFSVPCVFVFSRDLILWALISAVSTWWLCLALFEITTSSSVVTPLQLLLLAHL